MQLTCPGCGARYRIDATSWPTEPGPEGEPVFRPRRARCKVCRTVWEALPEEEVLELEDPLPPEDQPRLADAAWAAVAGWPDPRPLPAPRPDFTPPLDKPPPVFAPPGFTPPKDPSAPIYAAPLKPAIHFEAPPEPVQQAERKSVRPRLLGPGAYQDEAPVDPPEDEPQESGYETSEDEWSGEEWGDDSDDRPRRRIWLWLLAALLVAGLVWFALVASGRVRPEDYGLPPYDPAIVGLDRLRAPNVDMPAIALPRSAPSPLTIEAEAVRRQLSDSRQIWEVKGTIRNPTERRQPVPPVEIQLVDGSGRTVGRWMVRPELENLAPGGVARFETSAIDPPAEAARMRLQLKPGELGRL